MSAYTPGPWFHDGNGNVWRRDPKDLYQNGGTVAGDKPLATIHKGWHHDGAEGYPVEANARLITAAPELLEALHVVSECGDPCKVSLYDEEGIEGWRWTHPDGREWEETGEWCEGPPLHPVARAAIAKATGEQS